MAKHPRKPRSRPDALGRVAMLQKQVQYLKEQLEAEQQFHEGFLDSQRDLEMSLEKYANLYDLAPVGYLALDHNGLIQEANLTAAGMLGRNRNAVLGNPLQVFIAKANRRAFLRHLAALRRGESRVSGTLTLAIRNSAERTIELCLVRSNVEVRAPRGRCYYAVLTDNTERKAVEEALSASEKKYRTLFENIADEVRYWQLIRDEAGRIKTWRLVDINPAAMKAWGKTRSETIGKTADEIIPGLTAHFMSTVQKMVAEGVPQIQETYFPGRETHLRHTSVPLGEYFITSATDISEIKKAERILQDSNAELERRVAEQTAQIRRAYDSLQEERLRFFRVLEALPVMVSLLTMDHRLVFANRSFREKFNESTALHYFGQCFDLDKPCRFCEITMEQKEGPPHWGEIKFPDGSVLDVYEFLFADTDGTPMILQMNIDISTRVRTEMELRAAQENLEHQATQLRALATDLALTEQRERKRLALVLHDGLQQMLVAAKFQVALLDRAKDVAAATGSVSNLIDDCIETSRSLSAELSPPVLHQGGLVPALEWLGRRMRIHHGLCIKFTARGHYRRVPEVIEILLFQCVQELLLNVIKHSGTRHASIRVRQRAHDLQLKVSDKGGGFEYEEVELHPPDERRGLGLYRIRERLGYLSGEMQVDSTPGRGSTFTLTVPVTGASGESDGILAGSKASAGYVGEPHRPKDSAPEIRVVLVDDHRLMRQGLARLLNTEPDIVVVGEASTGSAAIDLVRETKPSVVLMDISMPEMDGIEATRRIHEQMPEIKIIALSMFNEGNQAEAIMAAGALKYLTKSGPSEAVISAIRNCMQPAGAASVH
jgi:PAS domain S-box-containing protein